MAVDPNVVLGVKLSPVRSAEEEGLQQANAQDAALKRQTALQKARDEHLERQALARYPTDINAAITWLAQQGAGPLAFKLQTDYAAQRKAQAEARKAEFEQKTALLGHFSQIAGVMKTPQGYAWGRPQLLAADPSMAQLLPEQFDPAVAERLQWMGVEALKALEFEQKKVESARDEPLESVLTPEGQQRLARRSQAVGQIPASAVNAPVETVLENGQPVIRPRLEAIGQVSATAAASAANTVEDNARARQALDEAMRHNRVMEARAGQGGSTTLSPAMESNVLNRLTTQWSAATKPARDLERQVSLMDAGMTAARRGDLAQGSQAVLITFQKILDPTSVVRESEYARSSAGLALDDRIRGAVERLTSGGAGVPLVELEKFHTLAKEAAKAQRGAYVDLVKDRLGRTADRYKIPRDLVFESDVPGGDGGGGASAGAAGPKEGDTRPITAAGYPAGAEATYRGGKWVRTK